MMCLLSFLPGSVTGTICSLLLADGVSTRWYVSVKNG